MAVQRSSIGRVPSGTSREEETQIETAGPYSSSRSPVEEGIDAVKLRSDPHHWAIAYHCYLLLSKFGK